MSFIQQHPNHALIVYTWCETGLHLKAVARHVHRFHANNVTRAELRATLRRCQQFKLLPPVVIQAILPPANSDPLVHLTCYDDGLRCRLCVTEHYLTRAEKEMRRYLRDVHHRASLNGLNF
jgi:hypothetical protein